MTERKILTLKEKMDILKAYEKDNTSVRVLAKRFNIGKTQASLIVRNKEAIRSSWFSGENINKKRNFLNEGGKNIDSMCYDWFCRLRNENTPISGRLIQKQAKEIAIKLGINNFAASNGWLQRWRNRHNITFRCGSKESINPLEFVEIENEMVPENSEHEVDEDTPKILKEHHHDSNAKEPAKGSIAVESNETALQYIAELKQFFKDDCIASEHLKNFEIHVQNKYLEEKLKNYGQPAG